MEENQETITQEAVPEVDHNINLWSDSAPTVKDSEIQQEEEVKVVEEIKQEAPKTEPVIQEKIVEVEKIVEKFPEFKDEYSKTLYEKLIQGDEDELYSYLSEKKKDYNTMSDIDVIKEQLRKQNPNWDSKRLDAQVKVAYGKNFELKDLSEIDPEIEPDKYNEAVAYNEAVEDRLLKLEMDAHDSRLWLNDNKKNLELPKIENKPEPKKELTQEEIDAFNREWEAEVDSVIPQISDLSYKIGDEEVAYKTTDEEKSQLAALMKGFNDVDYLTKRGWYTEDGRMNILKVAEDVRILENMSKIVSSVSTQTKTASKKELISEIKNIDLTKTGETEAQFSSDVNLWQI